MGVEAGAGADEKVPKAPKEQDLMMSQTDFPTKTNNKA